MTVHVMWTPPWKTTWWGFGSHPFPRRGCDEWHNKSWYVVWPLIGCVVWFPTVDRVGEEHVHAHGPDGFEGRIVAGCESCEQFVGWVTIEQLSVSDGTVSA